MKLQILKDGQEIATGEVVGFITVPGRGEKVFIASDEDGKVRGYDLVRHEAVRRMPGRKSG